MSFIRCQGIRRTIGDKKLSSTRVMCIDLKKKIRTGLHKKNACERKKIKKKALLRRKDSFSFIHTRTRTETEKWLCFSLTVMMTCCDIWKNLNQSSPSSGEQRRLLSLQQLVQSKFPAHQGRNAVSWRYLNHSNGSVCRTLVKMIKKKSIQDFTRSRRRGSTQRNNFTFPGLPQGHEINKHKPPKREMVIQSTLYAKDV